MATKPQAKTAIDNAVTDMKADIDTILPIGINITDGSLSFNPTRYTIQLDAGGNGATALSWLTSIQTNLTNAGRTNFRVVRTDRRSDDIGKKVIGVVETKVTILIVNF